jgi:hypothetical protein
VSRVKETSFIPLLIVIVIAYALASLGYIVGSHDGHMNGLIDCLKLESR